MNKYLVEKREKKGSSAQIKGRFENEKMPVFCHGTLCQVIWRDKAAGGTLWKNLLNGHKKYSKTYGSKEHRGKIPNKVSVDKRPEVVNLKERIGNLEIDTIIAKKQLGAILTAIERKTQYVLMTKLKSTCVKH